MSATIVRRRLLCRRRDDQAGFTLMEVLITLAISTVIMVPLLAWMMLSYRAQVVITHNSAATASRNVLSTYLPRDVGSAELVEAVTPVDCAAAPTPGAYGADRVVLQLVGAGTQPESVVYLARQVDSRSAVLIRRTCRQSGVQDKQVVDELALPVSTSVTVSCSAPCNARRGRVDIAATLTQDRGVIRVTASRRLGDDA